MDELKGMADLGQVPAAEAKKSAPPWLISLRQLELFRKDEPRRYNWDTLIQILGLIVRSQNSLYTGMLPMPTLFRARMSLTPDPFKSTKELGALSPERVKKYGRCHVPGQSVFYGAFNRGTAIAEISPIVDEYIHVMEYKAKPDALVKTLMLGERDYIRRRGKSDLNRDDLDVLNEIVSFEAAKTLEDLMPFLIDAFIADIMRRPAKNESDYRVTSAYCTLVLDHENKIPGIGRAKAIYYPSVAHMGGMNIAITGDAAEAVLQPERCEILKVVNYLGFGIYQTEEVAATRTFDADGEIGW